jgi:hypothetical protein
MFHLLGHIAVLSGASIAVWTASNSKELAVCSAGVLCGRLFKSKEVGDMFLPHAAWVSRQYKFLYIPRAREFLKM